MLVAECECGEDVPFVLQERTRSPVSGTCDCGRVYELRIKKMYDPVWVMGVKTNE